MELRKIQFGKLILCSLLDSQWHNQIVEMSEHVGRNEMKRDVKGFDTIGVKNGGMRILFCRSLYRTQ